MISENLSNFWSPGLRNIWKIFNLDFFSLDSQFLVNLISLECNDDNYSTIQCLIMNFYIPRFFIKEGISYSFIHSLFTFLLVITIVNKISENGNSSISSQLAGVLVNRGLYSQIDHLIKVSNIAVAFLSWCFNSRSSQ